ncbi:MAG: universal stress protein [Candidatus Latescibacteria bacterium]|nr:universal stress protein [Candidatus Latescibacterota bacterium]
MQAVQLNAALAAVDFSNWTGPVLRAGAEMARLYGASLTAVYAEQFLPPPYFTEGDIKALADLHALQRRSAAQHLAEVVRQEISYPAQARLVEAFPTEAILSLARELGAGLLVLGTHGRSGLNRLLMGSVAEKVVRQAGVPVLVVKQETPLTFRRLLCPVNYTPVALEALRHAADLASRSGAELVVMSVEEEPGLRRDHEEQLRALIPPPLQEHCRLRPVVRHGEAAEQILRLAAEENSDLVVVGAQHRPLLEATILGTTSVRVMRHAPCSALIVTRPHG